MWCLSSLPQRCHAVKHRSQEIASQPEATLTGRTIAYAAAVPNFKLVYFVPEEAREATRDAVFAAGGGVIGEYERCSWYTLGTGTFRGGETTAPSIGAAGQDERVAEYRVEIVVPSEKLEAAVTALRAAHPYEEVALDVYPLVDA